ncbi:MAG: alpha/beta hydrolase [Xanthomonadaceae bacterium]|jgi:pimeloyl-ACP methyl ester carboxylesterase|nr:alpha/beta hydrolase [Xanthomonadaceae bacterium]
MQWSSIVLAVVGTLLPLCDADARFPSDETPGAGQTLQLTPTPTAPTDRSPHTSGFAKAGDVKLHYLDWGGEGTTLLFIAGSGDNAHAFDELAPEFTDRFRVLALTRRGYGQSDRPDTGYDVATLTDDVRIFLDALKITQVSLAGHSAGGNELIEFAVRYPRRVDKLVFLDAAYDRREVPALEAKDPLFDRASLDKPWAERSHKERIQTTYFRHMDQYVPQYARIEAPALSFYAIAESHPGLAADADEDTRARAQVFVENEMQPYQWRNVERFRREVAKGQVVVLRDTHHYFFEDPSRKDEVVRRMRAFLSE